jgi:hypothetical protein
MNTAEAQYKKLIPPGAPDVGTLAGAMGLLTPEGVSGDAILGWSAPSWLKSAGSAIKRGAQAVARDVARRPGTYAAAAAALGTAGGLAAYLASRSKPQEQPKPEEAPDVLTEAAEAPAAPAPEVSGDPEDLRRLQILFRKAKARGDNRAAAALSHRIFQLAR